MDLDRLTSGNSTITATVGFCSNIGKKSHELTNYWGSVLSSISDNKYKNASEFVAFVLSQSD